MSIWWATNVSILVLYPLFQINIAEIPDLPKGPEPDPEGPVPDPLKTVLKLPTLYIVLEIQGIYLMGISYIFLIFSMNLHGYTQCRFQPMKVN